MEVTHLLAYLFLLNPKDYQNEIWKNNYVYYHNYLFLARCWGLKTSSRPFDDFNEMAIYKNTKSIFSS